MKSSEWVKGASDETDIVKWTFKDGTVLEVKQEEHSVRPGPPPQPRRYLDEVLTKIQTINHYITYGVITAKPELAYTSVLSTIRLFAVTSGDLEGSTFIEWTGNFSSDADASKSYPYQLILRCNMQTKLYTQVLSRMPSSSVAMLSLIWPRSSLRSERGMANELIRKGK